MDERKIMTEWRSVTFELFRAEKLVVREGLIRGLRPLTLRAPCGRPSPPRCGGSSNPIFCLSRVRQNFWHPMTEKVYRAEINGGERGTRTLDLGIMSATL